MRQRLADDSAEVALPTPAEPARVVHAVIAKWAKAVQDSGAKIDWSGGNYASSVG